LAQRLITQAKWVDGDDEGRRFANDERLYEPDAAELRLVQPRPGPEPLPRPAAASEIDDLPLAHGEAINSGLTGCGA